ncbi:MAG: hypothetical protein QY316_08655 [Thermodesulfobacteriota bacterium]|nr:MAG: hypothetical protein QY316_08655 [Thermodesulfobacteriota bacterium]
MLKRLVMALFVLVGTTSVAVAQDDEKSKQDVTIELEGRYLFPDFEADVRAGLGNIQGSDIDLERDFDADIDDIPIGRLNWYTGPKSRIFLEYRRSKIDGEAALARPITFKDVTYDVNASASAELEIDYYRLGWIWQFITASEGKFKFGTQLEARYLHAEATLEGQVGGTFASRSENFDAALPVIGLALDVNPVEEINLFVSVVGLPEIEGVRYFTAKGGLKFIPIRNFSISAGYRYDEVKAEGDNDDFIKVSINGPVVAASLRF